MDSTLYDAAARFIARRYHETAADVGAAAARTQSGKVLVSVGCDAPNNAAQLCYETGAICEAHRLDDPIVAIICLVRIAGSGLEVLPPCGICQERLFYWGGEIEVGVPRAADRSQWQSRSLKEMQPHYWRAPYTDAT